MARIRHAKTPSDALKGRDHVVVLASRAALADSLLRRLFRGRRWLGAVEQLVADTRPGPLGKLATTWTGTDEPKRVSVGVLSDSVSRHLSPSRGLAIESCLSRLDAEGALGLLVALDDPDHALGAINAVGRSLHLYDRKSKRSRQPAATLLAVDARGQVVDVAKADRDVVEFGRWAAELVDRPAAELSPADFVAEVEKALGGRKGVSCTVITGDDLLEAGLGGLHGVGRAAVVAPRLLVLQHVPELRGGTPDGPHAALIGKGVVYDTGGLNLKVGGHMSGMKTDMGGAAAVVGAFLGLVRARHRRPLSCVVPLAENAIGPTSYRPDDILTMHSGKTVEINNTDAEGRLLLADGVSWAVRELGAEVVIDAATLTGAQLVATGRRHAAVVSNREGLEAAVIRAGRSSGDVVHPLPFAPELYQEEFKSPVADMRNSVKDRMNAQASCAAQFVHSHVQDSGVPWLHVDLAGPAYPGDRATGYGVALFYRLLSDLTAADLES